MKVYAQSSTLGILTMLLWITSGHHNLKVLQFWNSDLCGIKLEEHWERNLGNVSC